MHQRDDLTLSADDRGTVDRIAKVHVLLYILLVLPDEQYYDKLFSINGLQTC